MKIVFAFSILAAGALLADNSAPDAKSRIKPLQNDLIATLQEVVDITQAKRAAAKASTLDVLRAQRPILDATLDAAETSQERLAVLESIVELEKKSEELAEAFHKNARLEYSEFLKVKATRIKAEIALEKEKSSRGN